MAKRKRSTTAAVSSVPESSAVYPEVPRNRRSDVPLPGIVSAPQSKPPRRQPSKRSRGAHSASTSPNVNPEVLDGISALRASPDGGKDAAELPATKPRVGGARSTGRQVDAGARASPALPDAYATTGDPGRNKKLKGPSKHVKVDNAETNDTAVGDTTTQAPGTALKEEVGVTVDPEVNEGQEDDADEEEVKEALSRPPPVNSDYLPLPWKGRLGYACLNTYLRNANPPVFSSRTCRIASILEHRHPLKDPSQPEHATKNRPDKEQPADVARGQQYVEELGLANARDIAKMVRWNDKYGIKFMRLSSEMFPFASHLEYGYKLEPFAAETLAEVGKVIAELGHRVTTHPGQFTQLGSPRKSVIDGSFRDLDYHAEMLSLLKLPPQQDRDAVMILHLGGAFGDKPAALDRFRENYAKLPQGVKNRLVLENDDVVWNVHEVLPLCQELNIPMVLDFHHHNILFDKDQIREGTQDIMDLFPSIIGTWTRKDITPKMHYSEPCPEAVTARNRRKHSPRVMTLPPCPDTMDLMIEAKDKEQAVFELMRTFKLPGFHLFNDIIPHVRQDENRPIKAKPKKAVKKTGKGKGKTEDDELAALDAKIEGAEDEEIGAVFVPEEEVGMGGPERRVYWPPGQEEWLRPQKRIVKKKEDGATTPTKKKRKAAVAGEASIDGEINEAETPAKKPAPRKAASSAKKQMLVKVVKAVPTPSATDEEGEDSSQLSDLGGFEEEILPTKKRTAAPGLSRRKSGRGAGKVSYKEEDGDEMSM
ncbi:UV-endonuclease UvdE-domain-containing protein [Clohesyomyces aquaticus]|uniref:UV-endonuclease UvdE-domain-containing protein n=1 Tax=Clohesyomyces aquaticus TaxID=1231657 RepID=A0A1Y1ZP79_9PLEO|nr:UV-endonuclease UvdE-domain-containing protein [Clohesyomyces aquaticus]